VSFPQEAMACLIPVTRCIRLILWRRKPHTSAELAFDLASSPRLWDLNFPQRRQQCHASTRGTLCLTSMSLVPASIQYPISLPIPTVASFPPLQTTIVTTSSTPASSSRALKLPPAPAPSPSLVCPLSLSTSRAEHIKEVTCACPLQFLVTRPP